MRKLLYIYIISLLIPVVFFSCSKDEFTELDLMEKIDRNVSFTIKVWDQVEKKPVSGAKIVLYFGDETQTANTDEKGLAFFQNIDPKSDLYFEISKEGFDLFKQKLQLSDLDERSSQYLYNAELTELTKKKSFVTIQGIVKIQTDLTNSVDEYPVGITVKVYSKREEYGEEMILVTSGEVDNNGKINLLVPEEFFNSYIVLAFPDLELDQKLKIDGKEVIAKTVFKHYEEAAPVPSGNISATNPSGFYWYVATTSDYYKLRNPWWISSSTTFTVNPNYGTGNVRTVPAQ